MSNKQFAERLNQGLDDIGVPSPYQERVEAFSKIIHVPRFKAEAILNGQMALDDDLLTLISTELEVSPEWLLGHEE